MINFPTIFISAAQYEQSPYDTCKHVGVGIKISQHPLFGELLIGTDEDYRNVGAHTPSKRIISKLEQLEMAYQRRDIETYIFLHERPWRFQALLDAESWTEKVKWFNTAGLVWVDCEGPGRNADVWKSKIFTTDDHHLVMSDMDRVKLDKIDQVNVYRGANSKIHAKTGLSWSLDRNKAIWFAHRFSRNNKWLATVNVRRNEIAALFTNRGESEIILGHQLHGVKIEKL